MKYDGQFQAHMAEWKGLVGIHQVGPVLATLLVKHAFLIAVTSTLIHF